MAEQVKNVKTQTDESRFERSLILKRKSNFRKVLFIQIPDSVKRTQLLQKDLPSGWNIPSPEAIISITGISHQFNLKDKHHLKRHLIEAVISTGSWIVTCGTESGVVQFIEDAVKEHVALTDYHIPIVGLLSQRVLDELKHVKHKESGKVKSLKIRTNADQFQSDDIPELSTKETLDPNHTQFIFLDDSKGNHSTTSTATSECRKAFNNFLSNICTENTDAKTKLETVKTKYDKLPIVLILIEGGVDAMKTASNVLKEKNPVIAIDGSGGAANFLASCYNQHNRGSNNENETNEHIKELIKECFKEDPDQLRDEANILSKCCIKNPKLVHVYSLEDKTAKVDVYIQNVIFNIYKVSYDNLIKKAKNKDKVKINAIKKQLELVEKWKRLDIAETEIFIARNRDELSYLQRSIKELFISSLVANQTEFVKLTMNRLENIELFLTFEIHKVYSKCISSKEEWAINLIVSDSEWRATFENSGNPYRVLFPIGDFIRDMLGDTNFKLYERAEKISEDGKKIELIDIRYIDKPFYHLFVWAVLMNWKEMANIFLEQDTDYTCSALFASTMLDKLAAKAYVSNNMELRTSLLENARFFETLGCKVMTELYKTDHAKALKTLVTPVDRYNCTPIAMAWSQKLSNFMAITACQAKLSSIWRGDIAPHTSAWRIGIAVFLPMLIVQRLGFISYRRKTCNTSQIQPSADDSPSMNVQLVERLNTKAQQTSEKMETESQIPSAFFQFYKAPIVKFFFYMITYLAFLVIFSLFVLTDLYPLSERSPSLFEYITWIWALSLAIEEIRQLLQTNKGSLAKNIEYWAKDVWNIFDLVMYILFFVSVILRCVLHSDDFYYARITYVITLAMFILRSMHFFFVTKEIGPKIVMIGKMLEDLAFFISLFALFVFSFGIMYQAVLFPNSVLSSWELFKNLVYIPYWQLYGELFLDNIEGTEPSECSNNPLLYKNGTMLRCAQTNQFNSLLLAIYLILMNILLVNILIAMFSYTFQKVQDNSEIIWKFHRYALVYEYYDRPMFPIPIVIHLCRIIVFCYYTMRGIKYKSDFELNLAQDEVEKLNIVESIALDRYLNAPASVRSRYEIRNMMSDERDMPGETDTIHKQHDIDDLYKEVQEMRQSLSKEISQLTLRHPVVIVDFPGNFPDDNIQNN